MIKRKKEKKKKQKTRDEDINHNDDVKENLLFSIIRNNRNLLKFTEKSNSFVIFRSTCVLFLLKFTFLAKRRQF